MPDALARSGGGSGTHVTTTGEHPLVHEGIDVELDTSAFSGLLSATDTTVQSAFDTLDEAEAAFNSVFLRLDTTNDPLTGDLDLGDNKIQRVDELQFDSNMRFDMESSSVLKLYVNSQLIHTWEDTSVVSSFLFGSGDNFTFGSGDDFKFGS